MFQRQITFLSTVTFHVKAENGKSHWKFKGKEKYELTTNSYSQICEFEFTNSYQELVRGKEWITGSALQLWKFHAYPKLSLQK